MTWKQLVTTPSRLTAEPVNRAEREWMLEQARVRGYIDTYRGVRISGTGRRFLVENAMIWNVLFIICHSVVSIVWVTKFPIAASSIGRIGISCFLTNLLSSIVSLENPFFSLLTVMTG